MCVPEFALDWNSGGIPEELLNSILEDGNEDWLEFEAGRPIFDPNRPEEDMWCCAAAALLRYCAKSGRLNILPARNPAWLMPPIFCGRARELCGELI